MLAATTRASARAAPSGKCKQASCILIQAKAERRRQRDSCATRDELACCFCLTVRNRGIKAAGAGATSDQGVDQGDLHACFAQNAAGGDEFDGEGELRLP